MAHTRTAPPTPAHLIATVDFWISRCRRASTRNSNLLEDGVDHLQRIQRSPAVSFSVSADLISNIFIYGSKKLDGEAGRADFGLRAAAHQALSGSVWLYSDGQLDVCVGTPIRERRHPAARCPELEYLRKGSENIRHTSRNRFFLYKRKYILSVFGFHTST